jgi:hypothetical protein
MYEITHRQRETQGCCAELLIANVRRYPLPLDRG